MTVRVLGKRLVNLYRVVRAGLYGDALAWFIDEHYQLTQILLAAVVGCPDLTAQWFEQILTGKIATPAALLAAMRPGRPATHASSSCTTPSQRAATPRTGPASSAPAPKRLATRSRPGACSPSPHRPARRSPPSPSSPRSLIAAAA
jgi:hypothetical protein